jgi:hypothetical protein
VRIRVALAGAGTLLTSLALASNAAAAQTARPLVRPAPSWYTPQLHSQVLRAGADGVKVGSERLNLECPGLQQAGVSAGGCIVSPFGCTANFIFTGGKNRYIGTARHCVKGNGSPLVMQVDSITIANVGTVAKKTSGGGKVGNDFALVRLDKAVVGKWGINPALPVGGPRGVYPGCDPQAVKFWGHGYGVAVGQGKPEGGLATNWRRSGYGFTGAGMLGDSGTGVVLADNRAAGNFTHLLVDSLDYPGSNLAGMRMTAILRFVGRGIRMVNFNGSPSASVGANCGSGGAGVGGGVGAGSGVAGTVNETADTAGDDAGEAAEEAGDAAEDAGETVEDAVDKVGDTVRGAL